MTTIDTNQAPDTGNLFKSPVFIGITLLWLAGILALATNGYFIEPEGQFPIKMPAFVALPVILFFLAFYMFPGVRRWADRAEVTTMTSLQSWRVIGGTFVFLWALDQLPMIFAFFAGFGDVAVGVFAAFATARVAKRGPNWRRDARAVIYVGMLDFVFAIGTGLASAVGYLKMYPEEVSASLTMSYPIVLFPTFIVPCFMILHFLAWRKIQ